MTDFQDSGYSWDIDFEIPQPHEQPQDTRFEPNLTKEYPLYKQRWGIKLVHPQSQPRPIRYWNGIPWKIAPELTRSPDPSDPPKGDLTGFGIGSTSCPWPFGCIAAVPLPTHWDPGWDSYPTSSSTAQDEIEDSYASVCPLRFQPHFLTLRARHIPSAEGRILLATEKLQELSSLHWDWTQEASSDKDYAKEVLLPRLRDVFDIIWDNNNNDGQDYMRHTNGKILKRNPGLVFEQGHGEDWTYNGKDCAPDLFTGTSSLSSSASSRDGVNSELDLDSDLDWGMVNIPIDVRIDSAADMRSANGDRDDKGSKNQVPRLLKYMALVVRNHPAMNCAYGISISGRFIRLWTADTTSFASTRCYSFSNKDHARDIVEILAFATLPRDRHIRPWTPKGTLRIRSKSAGTVFEQEIDPEETRLLEVRAWLFGSRTTVWAATPREGARMAHRDADRDRSEVEVSAQDMCKAGNDVEMATILDQEAAGRSSGADRKGKRKASDAGLLDKDGSAVRLPAPVLRLSASENEPTIARSPTIPTTGYSPDDRIVLKGSWLYEELKHHEETVLLHLHGEESPGREDLLGLYVEDHIDQEVIDHLPRALGLVEDEQLTDWASRPNPNNLDSLIPDTDPSGRARHFSILAVKCPLGKRLPIDVKSGTDLRHFMEILLCTIQSLWYTSSKGIHYRDFNPGNVVHKMLPAVGNTPARAVGWLIDFGNARVLRRPRLRPLGVPGLSAALQLSIDDGRSANRLYQSVCSMKAEDLRLRVEVEYAAYISAAAQPEVAEEAQAYYTSAIEDIEAEAKLLQHRYLDDVESALWLFCHILSVSYPWANAVPPKLDVIATKQLLWRGFLFPLFRGVPFAAFRRMIWDLTLLINAARASLAEQRHLPDHMTGVENQCFHDLCERIRRVIPELPSKDQT